ncbi:hypothetical protein ABZS66_37370 [Dactylosporangium sp. NPDC005572]|uniref:hypothetical protein n=1 Tax=Dactylosporangium sp. NPDC005572 TaxID=3156889 RepID=UPI0033AC276C
MKADLAFEPVTDRCRRCSKSMLLDVGGDAFGNVTGTMFCPSCGVIPQPSGWDAALIRACVAVVVNHSGSA